MQDLNQEIKPLSRSEKINLGTTEISKRIRKQLKQEFKGCEFSIRTSLYSGGSSINISLIKADFKVIKDLSKITEKALFNYTEVDGLRTREDIKRLQEDKHHQLNEYGLREEYDEDKWCNGVFLTEKGHNLFKRIIEIVDLYNYNDSDPQTDYFNVNFYLHLNIGKWDKTFIEVI